MDYINFAGYQLGELSVKGIMIRNECNEILITGISWLRIQCYFQNGRGFIEQLSCYQF
jgi:hypothetical protein